MNKITIDQVTQGTIYDKNRSLYVNSPQYP